MQLTKPTLRLTGESKVLMAVQRAKSARSKSATPSMTRRAASATCRLTWSAGSPMTSGPDSSTAPTASEGRVASHPQYSPTLSAKRQVSPIPTRRERFDEEAIKTRIFWEEWAKHVSREWAQAPQESVVKKQLVFSGQCNTEPTMQRSSSTDSLETNLSLLSLSTHHREQPAAKRRRRKALKMQKKEEKTDWSKLSQLQQQGMLERWIRQDQGRLQTTGQTPLLQSLLERPKATDAMTAEERSLLYHCALRSGLAGTRKSLSVENIMTIHHGMGTGPSGGTSRVSTATAPSSGKLPSSARSCLRHAVRVPSPRTIGDAERQRPRPGTSHGCPSQHARRASRRLSSVMSEATYRQLKASISVDELGVPHSPVRSHVVGFLDLESQMSLKVQRTVAATLEALHKSTGVGSNTTEFVRVPGEYGHYTADDYARYPRYPQHVRIAPQLSRLIRDDIKDRMGRPRHHALRVRDMMQFDSGMSQLGRAQRNLMIFNWLNSVSEENWDKSSAPSIYDVEGLVEETRYPDLTPGAITGQSDHPWPSLQEEDEAEPTDSANFDDSSQMTGSKVLSGTSNGADSTSVHSALDGEEAEDTNSCSL